MVGEVVTDRSSSAPRALVIVGSGAMLIIVAALVGWAWNDSAWDDIRAAPGIFAAPDEWTLVSEELSGSKRLTLWNSETRSAVLVYSTDQTGSEACRSAGTALRDFSGVEQIRELTGPEEAGPSKFCRLSAAGDFHGLETAFIHVARSSMDAAPSDDSVSEVLVVLREPVGLLS